MNKSNLDHGTIRSVSVLGAVVASACVMGLAGMVWLQADGLNAPPGDIVRADSSAERQQDSTAFLHASARDRSVPSADQVFTANGQVPVGDEATAPTF